MIKNGVKTVVLYLEGWQKRMVKDFLGIDCNTYEVPVGSPPIATHKYGITTDEKLKRMYFTEWQIREMKDIAGHSCEFVELHKDAIHILYMAPHA
jgi:hypothetical protein